MEPNININVIYYFMPVQHISIKLSLSIWISLSVILWKETWRNSMNIIECIMQFLHVYMPMKWTSTGLIKYGWVLMLSWLCSLPFITNRFKYMEHRIDAAILVHSCQWFDFLSVSCYLPWCEISIKASSPTHIKYPPSLV